MTYILHILKGKQAYIMSLNITSERQLKERT